MYALYTFPYLETSEPGGKLSCSILFEINLFRFYCLLKDDFGTMAPYYDYMKARIQNRVTIEEATQCILRSIPYKSRLRAFEFQF